MKDLDSPIDNFQFILSWQSPIKIQLSDFLDKKNIQIDVQFIDILYKITQLCLQQKNVFFKETGSLIIKKCLQILNTDQITDNKIKLLQAAYSYDIKNYENSNEICQNIIKQDCENVILIIQFEDSTKLMAFNIMRQIAIKYNQQDIAQDLEDQRELFALNNNIQKWGSLITEMQVPGFYLSEPNYDKLEEQDF